MIKCNKTFTSSFAAIYIDFCIHLFYQFVGGGTILEILFMYMPITSHILWQVRKPGAISRANFVNSTLVSG